MKDSNPSPFVYWAQTQDTISLKVDLKDAKVNINILLEQ